MSRTESAMQSIMCVSVEIATLVRAAFACDGHERNGMVCSLKERKGRREQRRRRRRKRREEANLTREKRSDVTQRRSPKVNTRLLSNNAVPFPTTSFIVVVRSEKSVSQ